MLVSVYFQSFMRKQIAETRHEIISSGNSSYREECWEKWLFSMLPCKFPCKRKFWYLQGKMQGIKIDKEIARKSSLKQGN
jgi:hypothetical protein